ncbi:MAG: 2-dehydropantoate 2-reductase [Puniceicoccales bacterium]|jgi:2-dehydropantoate 2-reductase|nr:2-dehydropantoate 2-reductase [Puniceicoccales bacterium]
MSNTDFPNNAVAAAICGEARPLKIAVVGAGAIGAYYGCRLAHAGHDVRFLLRSDLDAVRQNGFQITAPDLAFRLHTVQAFATTAEIGTSDLVIIALKTTANARFGELLPPLDNGKTIFLTLQNGMGNTEALAQLFGAERVTAGLCFVCVNRVAAGVIENYELGNIRFAEALGAATPRTRALVELFAPTGGDCKTVDSLERALWTKLCWNIPFNGLAIAGGGITTDRILASPPLRELVLGLTREVQAAAAAFGVQISDRHIESQISSAREMGAYKPSSLIDFLAGRPVETEAIWGEPLRRGQSKGVAMGRLECLFALLQHLTNRS